MSTVALQIWTGAYPGVINDITINVYAASDPLAIVASQTHAGPSHPADTWSFPGLDRTNYIFRIFETSGGVIIQQLDDDMNVVPAGQGGVNYHAPVQIEADVTTGFVSGGKVVTFDGTGGSTDLRGWDIDTIERLGIGAMKRGVDYSWDLTTATLTLLNANDAFGPQEWFNIQFQPQVTEGSDSTPSNIPLFATPKIITANYLVSAGADFGGLLIVDPATNYLELTLPDIATVVVGRVLTIEMRRAAVNKCCKILTQAGQTIDWMAGALQDLFICPGEFIKIYKFIDPSGPTSMYRVLDPNGNFMRVGERISDDNSAANVFNKIIEDGSSLDIFQFARLYDFVTKLPGAQVVNYDDWSTGNNKYKFSLANSSDPTKANQFHVPDRRGMYERITDGVRLPGDFENWLVGSHNHLNGVADDKPAGDGQNVFVYGQASTNMPGAAKGNVGNTAGNSTYQGFTSTVGGAENRVSDVAINKYLFV